MDQRAPQIEDYTTDRALSVIHGDAHATRQGKSLGHAGATGWDILAVPLHRNLDRSCPRKREHGRRRTKILAGLMSRTRPPPPMLNGSHVPAAADAVQARALRTPPTASLI